MRRLLLAGVALALALSTVAVAYSRLASVHGVYLVIHGLPEGYAAVYIEAMEPRGPAPLAAGIYRVPGGGTLVVKLPGDKLQALAEKWHRWHPGLKEFGVILHVLVLDNKGKLKLHMLDSMSLPIDKLAAGRPLILEAGVDRLGGTAAKLKGLETRQPGPWEALTLRPAEDIGGPMTLIRVNKQLLDDNLQPPLNDNGEPYVYKVCKTTDRRQWIPPMKVKVKICWDPMLYMMPVDFALLYNDFWNHIKYHDGLLYVETPIAIVYNKYSWSGLVDLFIGDETRAQSYKIYPSFGVDLTSLVEAAKKHVPVPLPSIKLWRGSGATWGGDKYYLADDALIGPNEKVTLYIYARPFFVIYNVTEDIKYPVGDAVRSWTEGFTVISDVLLETRTTFSDGKPVELKYIVSGHRRGEPPEPAMEALRQGGNLTYVTTLQPRQSILLRNLVTSTGGQCGLEMGISIPAGSIVAALACSFLADVPLSDVFTLPACAAFIKVASNFQVAFVAEPARLQFEGALTNHGQYDNIGYDAPEMIFVEQSSSYYRIGSCTARVPLGFYIEAR